MHNQAKVEIGTKVHNKNQPIELQAWQIDIFTENTLEWWSEWNVERLGNQLFKYYFDKFKAGLRIDL